MRKSHVCPTCKSRHLNIKVDYDYDEESRYDYFTCNNCGQTGLNVYKLRFDQQVTAEELGWDKAGTIEKLY